MQTVLAKIVADKAIWVEARKQQQPLASFQNEVVPTQRNFYDALAGTRTAFILECKKASPSKGLIREDFDPAAIASIYKHYASAISVLCDEKYFQGSFDFLPIVSKVAPQPILCKDFTIDPYQIYLARYYQADACLLMLSVLDDEQYRQLSAVAHSLNMGVLTEVSNWSTPHCGKLRETSTGSSCLCCTEHTFTAESEYGGGNPGNLRFQYYTVPGNHHVMVRGWYWLELADNNFAVFAAWATALCVTLCVCNHLLLFLLHGVGFQPA